MKRRYIQIAVSGFSAFLAIALTAGCENTVEPFADTTRHFAIYGFLDASADTQFVRVEATRPNLDDGGPAESDVSTITTQDLVTGDLVAWRDSTIELDDGSTGALFWAALRPVPDHPYRIEVTRGDGAMSSATTTVPNYISADVRGPIRTFAGTLEQPLVFENVNRRPESITLNYDLTITDTDKPTRITLDYDVLGAPFENGWKINVRLTRDRSRINARLSLQPTAILFLHAISLEVRLLSNDWPTIGQSQRTNNVVDGFGFFGSAATHRVMWQVDSLVVGELGFVDKQGDPSSGG